VVALTEPGLLAVWEAGRGAGRVRRALLLAAAAGADPASAADLALGRREELVLGLRERCFGGTFDCAVNCPSCGEELELELTADDVRVPAPRGEHRLAHDGFDVEFRLVTSRDLLAVDPAAAGARRALLGGCVVTARRGGRQVRVDELTDGVLDALAAALSTQDPQAGVVLPLDCAGCGHEWESPFDVGEYLWAELDAYARRLLLDVHQLASAYGWTEDDVLAVSPGRRQVYLDLVAS
jgi:hypothetical protein